MATAPSLPSELDRVQVDLQDAVNKAEFARAFQELWRPHRYKVMWGGRGAAKSWTVARYLVLIAVTNRDERILCGRELQSSIRDSVHQLLSDQIFILGLSQFFIIERDSIRCWLTGSSFLFKGLRHNYTEIKSTEGITRAWIEEAQLVSKESWQIVIPTIRMPNSEIIVTFNPLDEDADTYQRFVVKTPPDAWVAHINWDDNPWFPEVLELERQYMLKHSPEDYEHVWMGAPLTLSDAVIFRGKYVVDLFDMPDPYTTRLFHGADFGFADDPATLMGPMWVTGAPPVEDLWIYNEQFGWGVEIDHLPAMYDLTPTSRNWPIKADNARPETISYLRRQGFNISAAEKWVGCVEDRIAHLKGFRIHIHATNCPHLAREARLYKYKIDKVSGDILPIIVDKNNHGWDGIGYGLDGYVHKRGASKVWSKLAH